MSETPESKREKPAYVSSGSVLDSTRPLFDKEDSHKRRKTFGKRKGPDPAPFFLSIENYS